MITGPPTTIISVNPQKTQLKYDAVNIFIEVLYPYIINCSKQKIYMTYNNYKNITNN